MKWSKTLVGCVVAGLVATAIAVSMPQTTQPVRLGPFWQLTGNQQTRPPEDFLGTSDARALVFKTNALGGGGERMRIDPNGNLGIGVSSPGERLHLGDGNILVEGGGETALIFKRDTTFDGVSGLSVNPIFKLGRIIGAGDGDPELRVLYSDDAEPERSVFEFDRKGIVASVKPESGSHFEGFLSGDPAPVFRLNSFPSMQLEMGPGGVTETDVILRREPEGALTLHTDRSERLRVSPAGDIGIGTDLPQSALHIAVGYLQLPVIAGSAPPAADCNSPAEAGRMIVRRDGPPDLYVCRGTAGWVGK